MWVLECEGDLLGYKKQWLQPGQTYTIGRAGQGDKTSHPIPGKYAMSRKHLVLEVLKVTSGSGLSTFARSEIKATDASKHGTVLDDGEQIKGCTITLTQEKHTFTLGKCPHKFVVSWHPKIFTFAMSKQQRGDKKYMKRFQDKMEKFDVKTIDTFVSDKTTHVVSDKRNTSKSLLALVNGLHIVSHAYIDEIVRVCARDPKDPEEMSLLEQDYEMNWPDPAKFVPPPANEPIKRDSAVFAPDPRRKVMMTGWVVVVGETGQKDNLLEVVTEGGGKLVFQKVDPKDPKTTTPQGFVDAAGKASKVIFVQPQASNFKGYEKVVYDFISKVEKLTGYHTAGQNEFLDALITIDINSLRRPMATTSKDQDGDVQMELITHPPAEKSTRSSRRTSAAKTANAVPEPPAPEMELAEKEPVQQARQARSRSSSVDLVIHKPSQKTQRTQFTQSKPSQAVSRFDDSDDDFEPLPAPSASMSVAATQQKSNRHVSQVAFAVDVVEEEGEDDHSETQTRRGSGTQRPAAARNVSQTASSLRKRPATQIEEEEATQDGNVMERILPGAAAMKKRRLEEEKKQELLRKHPSNESIKTEPMDEDAPGEATGKKKSSARSRKKPPVEEDEVIKATREIRRREEAEEAARRAEADRMDADGELAGLKNLALVETFDIIPRQNKPVRRSDAYGDDGSRWDEKWNGRKNFKKFRRKDGTQVRMRRAVAPVLVELVEHKARDFGIGDDYWLDKRRGKEAEPSQPEGNSQYATANDDSQIVVSESESEEDELRFVPISQPKTQVPKTQTQTQKTTQRNTQSQNQPASVSRSTRSTRSTNIVAATQDTPTTTGTRSQTAAKRTKPTAAAPPKKKQKTSKRGFLAKHDDSDDDSEDELKFKF